MIIGIGMFSYGVSEMWNLIYEKIEEILRNENKIDILIEDKYSAIENLNKIIKNKKDIEIEEEYNGYYKYPLMRYTGKRSHDSIEYISFISKLKKIRNRINIYGIDIPLTDNDIDMIQYTNRKNMYNKRWGEIEIKDEYSKYVKEYFEKDKDYTRDEFMYESINKIKKMNNNTILYIAHNEHVQSFKLGGYKTCGFLLKKKYRREYKNIATIAEKGKIKFDGEYEDNRNTINIYNKPLYLDFEDKGSLVEYIKKNKIEKYKENETPKRKLSYLSLGYLKSKYENKKSYKLIDYFDKYINMGKVENSNNIIL